ncbi:hypothetical protein PRZ48_007678 [Zasmidium cellare]|uniref:Uncharacterized protein n=1 Tax=Zasmidium cellare TaxID=395010 RepID=A0ABR0EKE6_ZASCE|nr:hypothetical protein PRZ48_007678 [Zasmidium cellare]
MCRRVIALYDLCYDADSRPSTCNSSRPVNSPRNDVYFGLQRCTNAEPCGEAGYYQTVYLPLVARTCSDTCEQDLNMDYWHERRRTRRKEYNPFLDRMLCLGRDSRLYHVVTGECMAKEEQFGDDPPLQMAVHEGMLPEVPWEQATASAVGDSQVQANRAGTGGDTDIVGESMVRFGLAHFDVPGLSISFKSIERTNQQVRAEKSARQAV